MNKLTTLCASLLVALAMPSHAQQSATDTDYTFADAVRAGKSLSSFRLRDEWVAQDGKADQTNALTLRSLVGWQSAAFHNISIGAQLIHVGVFDDGYDNGDKGVVQPGRATYPRIADPDYTGINQLYVDWTGIRNTRLRVGRQSVKLDNVRFVGNVEFRQVMQVYDGVSVENKSLLPDTTLFAAHFSQLTQVSTLRQDTDISIVNARYAISSSENLVGYGYFVGWDRNTLQATSSRTLGVRLDGARPLTPEWKVLYTAEYAKQDPYKDGASTIDSYYARLGAGAQYGPWFARIDHEVLSSNQGQSAFQTPLGTNHLFQGWVDKFLVTPKQGIRDTFVTAGTKLGQATLLTEYHWFESDVPFVSGTGTASRLGREWDISVTYPVSPKLMARLEYGRFTEGAQYTAARYRDTDKLWLTAMYSF